MNSHLEYRQATIADLERFKAIHFKYHVSNVTDEEKADGFVTTNFTDDQLIRLIEANGIFICLDREVVVGYVTAASWDYWKEWPMYEYMIGQLPQLEYKDSLTTRNSYQYGPVCIDKDYRGQGILEELFHLSAKEMSKRFDYLITFINKVNPRSFAMHTRKLKLEVINEFTFNNNNYYELIYPLEGEKG